MHKIKGGSIHGINSLLTRINLTLYSLNNKVNSPEDVKKIENGMQDIKILQRRVENIFGLVSPIGQVNLARISIEEFVSFLNTETRGQGRIEKHLNNSTKFILTDVNILRNVIDEILTYFALFSFELLKIHVECKTAESKFYVVFTFRSDNLSPKINNDLQDEQEIRKEKIMYIGNEIGWTMDFRSDNIILTAKIIES